MIKTNWAACLLVGAGLMASPALADGLFAAIAFSPSTGQTGSAWNYADAPQAETEANSQCANDDCYTAVTFRQCGAIAVGDEFGMGFAADATSAKASETALANCNGYTTNCTVAASFCNEGF